jgi:hypothetical protein
VLETGVLQSLNPGLLLVKEPRLSQLTTWSEFLVQILLAASWREAEWDSFPPLLERHSNTIISVHTYMCIRVCGGLPSGPSARKKLLDKLKQF